MKTRCFYPNCINYDRYGGRGIKVCDEWKTDFVAFRDWALSNGYSDELQIDRINNDGDYAPNNCKWSTRTEQTRNRSNTICIEIDGIKKTLMEWCKEKGINYNTAFAKYKKGIPPRTIFGL